ncbi:MAG: hypothetical protein ThorAB25_15080 [Candidatus Thorarchaeota archaeon AB_25]|nr:MAG: hypothetical protein ThorAB25_15080 [Candidatus Thorarchaeota archaeon AB_25]
MSEKIYVISCSQDLQSLGMDRLRTAVEGMEERTLSLDWSKVRLVPVIANEKVAFAEGQSEFVPIKPISIPGNSTVFQSFYGVNGMGHLSCIGSQEFKRPDEDRTADMSIFQSRIKASVLKGDLLGQVLIVPGQ